MALFDHRVTSLPIFSPYYGHCANQAFPMANHSNQKGGDANLRKRPLETSIMDEADAPLEKKRFEQIQDEFSKFNINSPLISEIEDDGVIDMEEPTTSDDAIIEDEPEFYVEEPEEAGQLVLSNDLNEYLKRMKSEPLLPPKNNLQLVLYSPADSIISRIIEVKEDTPDDETEEEPRVETNSPTPSASPASQTEELEQMETD